MTIADICILIAAVLPYVTVGYAKALSRSTFNNADPRNPKGYSGKAERAKNAQLTALRTFHSLLWPSYFQNFTQLLRNIQTRFAVGFIVVRLCYTYAYIHDRPTLRSVLFGLGFLISMALFLLPAFVA